MLKRLENFFLVGSYMEIFLFFLVIFTTLYFLLGTVVTNNFTHTSILQISFCVAIVTSGFGLWSVQKDRQNDKFWGMANELEIMISETNDMDKLLDLHNEEWTELKENVYNKDHAYEVRRLYDTIKTKYEILQNSNVTA